MKPQFKPEEIYLDLSKLSKEQQRKVIALLPIDNISAQIYFLGSYEDWNVIKKFTYLFFNDNKVWQICDSKIPDKTELSYTQFLEMMGETSGEKPKDISFDTWVNMFVGQKQANPEKELINNDGTLYIGEGLENYYKDQLERTGKFKVVSIEDYNKLQTLLNHKPNPDYQSDPFPGQLG